MLWQEGCELVELLLAAAAAASSSAVFAVATGIAAFAAESSSAVLQFGPVFAASAAGGMVAAPASSWRCFVFLLLSFRSRCLGRRAICT